MDRLIFSLCLLLDLIQVLLILQLYKNYWKRIEPFYLLLIKIFLFVNLYKLLSNGVVVDILRIISGGAENQEYGVSSVEILEVIFMEFISNIVYFASFTVFLILMRKDKSPIYRVSLRQQVAILIPISLVTVFNLLFPSLIAPKFWLFQDAIVLMGPICAIILLFLGIKYKRRFLVIIGLIPLVIIIMLVLVSGLRGSIVGIAICFTIFAIIEFEKKKLRRLFIISLIPIFIIYKVSTSLSSIKYAFAVAISNKTFDFSSFSGYVDFVTAYLANDSRVKIIESDSKPMYREIEFRYGAPTLFAVGFHRMAARGEYAFLNPIMNSFYSYLPRQLFTENKPFPGSADGTEKSMGMYKSMTEITGSDVSMTDFSVGSHYFWELGWFGVIFLSIIPAIYNVIVFQFCKRLSYIGAAVLLLSFKPFWLMTKLWVSEIITMIPTVMLPAVLMIFILRTVTGFLGMLNRSFHTGQVRRSQQTIGL